MIFISDEELKDMVIKQFIVLNGITYKVMMGTNDGIYVVRCEDG